MFSVVAPILTLLASVAVSHVRAEVNPTTPGPGDVYIQGKSCTIAWDADTTGTWKSMSIQLMTGNNFDMIPLTTVASNIDGTSATSFSYTCPVVSPHSAIYFYQLSSPSTSNKTWTTRFTITDSVNDVVPPTQSTQPDGQSIPWGTGQLVSGSGNASSSGSSTSSGSGSSVLPASTGAAASGSASTVDSTPSTIAASSSASSSTTPDVVYSTTYVVEPSPSSTVSANQTSSAATTPAGTAVLFFFHTWLAAIVFSMCF